MSNYTLDRLISMMRTLMNEWHRGTRQGNDGNAGNTLEDLLDIPENNLSLPDFGEIEIKTQRYETGSLITLFHKEAYPLKSVPALLRCLGWSHSEAGARYPSNEMSFRSTTYGHRYSDRGFRIVADSERILFIFSPSEVNVGAHDRTGIYNTYGDWLNDVENRSNPNYREIMPLYYTQSEIEGKFTEKINHTLFVLCRTKTESGIRYYMYEEAFILRGFRVNAIPTFISEGNLIVDFDARTGHNHGTKFRVQKNQLYNLFNEGYTLD